MIEQLDRGNQLGLKPESFNAEGKGFIGIVDGGNREGRPAAAGPYQWRLYSKPKLHVPNSLPENKDVH